MSSFNNCSILLGAIQDAWKQQHDISRFSDLLSSHQEMLRAPLDQRPSDEKDKQDVQKGVLGDPPKHIKLSNEFVRWILEFSASVDLNEKLSGSLLRTAFERHKSTQPITEVMLDMYYSRRQNLLLSLLDLVKMYESLNVSKEVREVAGTKVTDLVQGDIVAHLLGKLQAILQLNQQFQEYKDREIWNIIKVLFYLCDRIQLENQEVLLIVQILREWRPKNKEMDQKWYRLLLVLLRAFEPVEKFDLRGQGFRATNKLLRPGKLFDEIINQCAGTWFNDTARGTFEVVLITLLRMASGRIVTFQGSQDLLKTTMEAFKTMERIFLFADEPDLDNAYSRDSFAQMGSFLLQWMTECEKQLGELVSKDQQGTLLKILSQICEISPDSARKMIEHKIFEKLLAEIPPHHRIKLFGNHISLLIALQPDGQNSDQMFDLLQSSQAINPLKFVELFGSVIRLFSQSTKDRKAMNGDESDLVRWHLRLLRSLATSHSMRDVMRQHELLKILFDMFLCFLPAGLKAEILHTVAAFVENNTRDVKLLIDVWTILETLQFLPKHDVIMGQPQPHQGLMRDIENVESAQFTYPVTTAFCRLLDSLVASFDKEKALNFLGYKHFLNYIIRTVFMTLHSRRYDNPNERWALAASCISTFTRLFYIAEEFKEKMPVGGQKNPGEHFMSLMDDHVFKEVLAHMLNATLDVSGSEDTARVTLHAMKLLAAALKKELSESNIADVFSSRKCDLIVSQGDYVIAIAESIGNSASPQNGYWASVLLQLLAVTNDKQIVAIIRQRQQQQVICASFAEPLTPSYYTSDDKDGKRCVVLLRLSMIKTLAQCIHGSPSLTHLLLGFDVDRPELSELAQGQSDERCGCLEHIMAMVEKPRFVKQSPALAESCFELFYKLCLNKQTSAPFLSYIQSNTLFFVDLLLSLKVDYLGDSETDDVYSYDTILTQQEWLLKCIALQLHVAFREQGDNSTLDILKSLGFYGGPINTDPSLPFLEILEDIDRFAANSTQGNLEMEMKMEMEMEDVKTDEFRMDITVGGSFKYDIHKLHDTMADKGVPEALINEKCKVFHDFNTKVHAHAKVRRTFDGWRKLVEVCLHECFTMERDPEKYEFILFRLLGELLNKLQSNNSLWTTGRISGQVSVIILTIMIKLRDYAMVYPPKASVAECCNILKSIGNILKPSLDTLARRHIYLTLINYVKYADNRIRKSTEDSSSSDEKYMHASTVREQHQLEEVHAREFGDWGAGVLQVALRDCTSTESHLQAMASTVVYYLISRDWRGTIRGSTSSYVGPIIEQIQNSCEKLIGCMRSPGTNQQEIDKYQTLMTLLLQAAKSESGATAFSRNISKCLEWLSFLKDGRHQQIHAKTSSNKAKQLDVYYSVINPILALIAYPVKILKDNKQLHYDVLGFLLRHHDIIDSLINGDDFTPSSLMTLKLITQIMYLLHEGPLFCSTAAASSDGMNVKNTDFHVQAVTHRRKILLLLPKFSDMFRRTVAMQKSRMFNTGPTGMDTGSTCMDIQFDYGNVILIRETYHNLVYLFRIHMKDVHTSMQLGQSASQTKQKSDHEDTQATVESLVQLTHVVMDGIQEDKKIRGLCLKHIDNLTPDQYDEIQRILPPHLRRTATDSKTSMFLVESKAFLEKCAKRANISLELQSRIIENTLALLYMYCEFNFTSSRGFVFSNEQVIFKKLYEEYAKPLLASVSKLRLIKEENSGFDRLGGPQPDVSFIPTLREKFRVMFREN